MASAQPSAGSGSSRTGSISGISNRRSACDECRFSKSRCLRQRPDQTRCDRCSRNDSECAISPIFRLRSWQPPNAGAAANTELTDAFEETAGSPNGNKRPRRSSKPSSTISRKLSSLAPDPISDTASQGLVPVDTGIHVVSREAITTDWLRQSVSPLTTSPPWGPSYETAGVDETMDTVSFGPDLENMLDVNLSPHFFSPINVPPPPPPPPLAEYTLSQQPFPFDSTHEQQAAGGGWGTTDLIGHGDGGPQRSDKTETQADEVEQTPLQCLSKLDHDLVTILTLLEQGTPKLSMRTLVETGKTSAPSVAHQILNKTTEFVRVLELLAGTRHVSCATTPGSVSSTSNNRSSRHMSHDDGGRSTTDDNDEQDDNDSIASSPRDRMDFTNLNSNPQRNSPSSTPCSLPIQQPPPLLDTPSLLSVLVVYMRLVQLYLIVFAHVNAHLKELSQSDNPKLGPISGLAFSSFPMQSGNLQTLILIQIVTNLFEKMDDLLALPKECRISRRRRQKGAARGILGQSPGFLELARCILEQEECANSRSSYGSSGKPAGGGIRALRKHIVEAKQLLRESIAP